MELQFKNVTKDYGNVHAVEHVTHSMGKGVYGLLGVNGAGKTTLMRMICTAITPTSGEILWNGKDIFSQGASYREILGYLPQSYGFYPDLSVYDYMLYIASIKGIRPIMAKKRALKLLEQVGMAEKRKRKMRTLSGGMIRRVGIAQAMLNDPRILVLDEPTAGLDPNERIRFRNLISELSEDRLVLLSTHIVSDVEYVTKDYGNVHAVEHVTHSMGKGVYGLLGVNGAGKTTLMRMICTAITPTSGEILWNGKDIFSQGASYREILGYLPQSYGFYPDLSVYDYMLYIASIKGIRPIMAKKRALKLLEQVGMAEKRKRKMRTLSGGMIRRVGIAQAMLNDPRILVLDEPTAGLDPNERIRFRNLISELSEDRLVLLSTHIVSDVEYVANEIILMKEGKFFYTGTSDEIILSMDMFVWNCIIPKSELNNYMKKYLIGNVRTVSDGVELRVLSKMPPTGNAVQVEATLEDAFLLYFGEKAGDKDDVQI